MEDAVFKPVSVAMFVAITAPNWVSIIASAIASVYFISMLKMNVVDKVYNGDWLSFWKAFFTSNHKWDKNK